MAEQVNAPITISMALDMRRNRIRIHKPTIHLLGDPTLLQLLFDPEDMVVAIVCRDTEVSGGQEVRINPRGLKSRNCFEFCSSSDADFDSAACKLFQPRTCAPEHLFLGQTRIVY